VGLCLSDAVQRAAALTWQESVGEEIALAKSCSERDWTTWTALRLGARILYSFCPA
jgi:hypothetical protein